MELNKDIPNKKGIMCFVNSLKIAFYPYLVAKKINTNHELKKARRYYKKYISKEKVDDFFKNIDHLKDLYDRDIKAIFNGDPAADTYSEIVLAYPGFTAIFYYRIAHIIFNQNFKIIARIISEEAHFLTGTDIHPGAQIGESFMIDHGTGIVIGETTIIGNNVRIYQGVTLGALSLSRGHALKNTKRHPTIGNNVIIYSGVSILGGKSVVGDNSIIGSNVYITESVPKNSVVTTRKFHLVTKNINKEKNSQHSK